MEFMNNQQAYKLIGTIKSTCKTKNVKCNISNRRNNFPIISENTSLFSTTCNTNMLLLKIQFVILISLKGTLHNDINLYKNVNNSINNYNRKFMKIFINNDDCLALITFIKRDFLAFQFMFTTNIRRLMLHYLGIELKIFLWKSDYCL